MITSSITSFVRGVTAMAALGLLTACGDSSAPVITSYGVRLNGATADHGAAMLNLRNLPANVTFTPAAGLVFQARKAADGQAYSVFVAGDLTRAPLFTFAMPQASSQLGTVQELARQDGSLVTSGMPLVMFTAQ